MADLMPGQRLVCPECATEVITVRPGTAGVELTCAGVTLADPSAGRRGGGHPVAGEHVTQIGKRYEAASGLELLCVKAGSGELACDGVAMTVKGARPLPSSD